MRTMKLCIVAAAALVLVGIHGVGAQERPSIDQAMAQLTAVRRYGEAMISPDGQSVAWVESLPANGGTPSQGTAIFVAPAVRSGSPVRITAATSGSPDEHGISWSPDGRSIAFLSDAADPGQLQLYVAPASGGSPRKLTSLKGYLSTPQWSPDGRTIAILFTENAPRASGPLQPRTPDVGVVEDHYFEQRLTTVNATSGQVRQLSPPDLYVYEYDWSPDGKRMIATAAHGEGDDNWYVAQLYTVDAASGDTHSILKPGMQIASPRWSPDGQSVAFIGGLMSDEGIASGDVYTVAATGGTPHDVTPGMNASAFWLAWLPGPSRIVFAGASEGQSAIGIAKPEGGPVQMQWTGAEKIHGARDFDFGVSLTRDGKTSAVIRESYSQPPEVWSGPIGSWRQITTANRDVHPLWGEGRSLHWTSDQFTVQGWLVFPKDYDPSHKYPMVVWVHGGPEWTNAPEWPDTFNNATILADEGYFVFYPNFRGGSGRGEAFTRANVKDFGYGDLRDILAGMTHITHTLPVDSARIGITGWSYGGYMTMWAVTQTRRFRAAVSGAGLANWLSYYGENGIDKWMDAYFGGNVYDHPDVYARSAPITFIKNVRTPTLIVVGDRDIECPPPQSYEFWHALRTFGVKTEFVIYPNEGHTIWQPEHRTEIVRRMAAWFDENMPRAR